MLKNIGSNWALALVQIFVLFLLTSVQIQVLGTETQGVWLAIAGLMGHLGLLILGVPMASVRFIAQHVAKKDINGANRAISTCLAMCLGLGAFAIMVGAIVWVVFEHAYLGSPAWQGLSAGVRADARIAYALTVLWVGLGFAAQLPFGVFDAHHDFVARNAVKLAGLVLRTALIAGVLRVYPSLVVVALTQLACTGIEFCAALVLIRKRCPGIRFRLASASREELRPILGFSLFVLLLSLGSQLAFRSDVLVIGAYLEPSQGTYFDIGNKFFPPLIEIVLGIGMVVMPMAAKLQTTGNMDELRHVFLKWSKISLSIALCVGAYLIVLGPEFIAWWMGESFAMRSGRVTQLLMVSFLAFLPVRGVALPVLTGLGKPARPAIALLGMGVFNLVLSLALVKPCGIVGVAIGTAIPNVCFAVVVAYMACRELCVPLREYASYVGGRTIIGVLPSLALLLWLKRGLHLFQLGAPRWQIFVPLFFAGFAMVAVFAATWVLFVYRGDPYFDITAKLARFLPKTSRRSMP